MSNLISKKSIVNILQNIQQSTKLFTKMDSDYYLRLFKLSIVVHIMLLRGGLHLYPLIWVVWLVYIVFLLYITAIVLYVMFGWDVVELSYL